MAGNDKPAAQADAASLDAAWRHVDAVVSASGTSFLGGMRILPKPRRMAMYAIYAFCREIDDIADDPLPAAEKATQLEDWRQEIARLYQSYPRKPTAVALQKPVAAYDLRQEDFLALIDGMEMDAKADLVAPPLAELDLYCARVAGAVGLLSVRVFGATEPESRDLALSLGRALQLTNILRDLREDADRGRLYLPLELLQRHGIETRDPAAVLAHPNLPAVCDALAEMAEQSFAEAVAAMAHCRPQAIKPAVIMMQVYRRTLEKLKERGWKRLDEPVRVSKLTKLWLALRHGLF